MAQIIHYDTSTDPDFVKPLCGKRPGGDDDAIFYDPVDLARGVRSEIVTCPDCIDAADGLQDGRHEDRAQAARHAPRLPGME